MTGGEQHNFGREIDPVCTITLLPEPHLPLCPPSRLEDEIGKKISFPLESHLLFGGDGELAPS